jgi:cell division septation protein DedD
MEMLRGDRTPAQRHLQRLVIEYPNGAERARASYWLARIFFEANELTRGCHELTIARSKAAPGDVELRNQVDYEAQRCVGVELGSTAAAPVASPTVAAAPPAPPVATTRPPPPPTATGRADTIRAATRPGSPPPNPPRQGRRMFTVQVAAFPDREEALTFMESLKARGYDVRVWGTENPFRVRIGRFASRDEANALAAELRAKMISRDAWVTEAEVR